MTMPYRVLPVVLSAGATAAGFAWALRFRRQSVHGLALSPRATPKRDSVLADLHAAGRWTK
ncbi:MAG: hypothetical protein ABW224_03950 [Kibdelosporangium sp.]